MKDLSIYIHIPFCARKCAYCDFLSFSGMDKYHDEYVLSLINEIKLSASEFSGHIVKTIFFGGGTPTLLRANKIGEVLNVIFDNYSVDKNAEISTEANPETVDAKSLKELRAAGFNRLSFGVQAFNNRLLQRIERIHTKETAVSAVYAAREAGFKNINLDLMFALPGQSLADLDKSLDTAVFLDPEHLSAYSLILEEGSKLFKESGLSLPDDDTDRDMYELVKEKLKKAGYKHYEISNFAKEGFDCRHNRVYWTGGEYRGFGLGAHSLVNGVRFHNTGSLKSYVSGGFEKEEAEILSLKDKMSEFMFLGLRLVDGIKITDFYDKFEQNIFSVYGKEINECVEFGLLAERRGNLRLTDKGIDLSNAVFAKFI